MIIDPAKYKQTPAAELLAAAAEGHIGLDQRVLHALLDDPQRSLPGILEYAAKNHDEERIDLTDDLLHMFTHLGRPEAIPFLMACIEADPLDVSENVVRAFLAIGEPAVEPLLQLYERMGPRQGGEVAFALAAMPVRDPRIVKLLVERLSLDPDDAVLCLALHADPRAVPALETYLRELEPGDDATGTLRREIREAIAKLRSGAQSEVEPFDIWPIYPEESLPCFEVLNPEECFALLKSPVARWRAEAAHCFTMEELTERQKDRLFNLAQKDPAPEVRARCWEALSGQLKNPAIRNAMMARLQDERAPLVERCGALLGLAPQVGRNAALRRRLLAFYEDPRSRAKALEAMWRALCADFDEYFPRHLDDEDLEVRRHAILGVGYRALSEHAIRLAPLFRHEVLRVDALYAYALSAPIELDEESVRQLFEEIEDLAGMDTEEAVLVQNALDDRLEMAGLEPIFLHGMQEASEV